MKPKNLSELALEVQHLGFQRHRIFVKHDSVSLKELKEEAKKWIEYYEQRLDDDCERANATGRIEFIKEFFGVE